MFRKERDLTERSRTLLKNKETRSLKAEIAKQFTSVSEDDLNLLLPNKVNLTCIKLADRTILYAVDDVVLFFDVKGRNNLFPSCVALWKLPHLLKSMITHGPVSRNLIRGADLMVPGVIQRDSLAGLQDQEKCAIRIRGNPLPFAVGTACMDYSTIATARRGKAMEILHCYGDLLVPPNSVVLPPGYLKEEVCPTETQQADSEDDGEDEEQEDEEEAADVEIQMSNEKRVGGDEVVGDINEEEDAGETQVTDDVEDIDLATTLENLAVNADESDNIDGPEEDGDQEATKPPTAHSEDVLHAFVLLLKHVTKDNALPLLFSALWPQLQRVYTHLFPASTVHLAQAVRLSTFRKPAQVLAHCQRNLQLLQYEEKTPGVYTIISVQRTHALFRSHSCAAPEALRAAAKTPALAESAAHDNSVSGAADMIGSKKPSALTTATTATTTHVSNQGSSGKRSKQKLEIIELLKLPRQFQDLFRDCLNDAEAASTSTARTEEEDDNLHFGDHILRPAQVRKLLQRYVQRHGLLARLSGAEWTALSKGDSNKATASGGKGQAPASASSSSGGMTVLRIPATNALFDVYRDVGFVSTTVASSVASVDAIKSESSVAPVHSDDTAEAHGIMDTSIVKASISREGVEDKPVTDTSEKDEEVDEDEDEDGDDRDPVEARRRLLALQQASAAEDESTNSLLFSAVDRYYQQEQQAETDKEATKKKGGVNAAGNTIFWKAVSLSSAPASKTANKKKATVPGSTNHNSNNNNIHNSGHAQKGQKANTTGRAPKSVNAVSSSAGQNEDLVRTVTWEDAIRTLLSRLTVYHAFVTPSAGSGGEVEVHVHSGAAPKLQVLTEKRAGNKTVTLLRHLEAFADILDVDVVVKLAQKRFACSVAVNAVPGIASQREIVIQGPFAMEIAAFLQETQGLLPQYVEVVPSKHLVKKKR